MLASLPWPPSCPATVREVVAGLRRPLERRGRARGEACRRRPSPAGAGPARVRVPRAGRHPPHGCYAPSLHARLDGRPALPRTGTRTPQRSTTLYGEQDPALRRGRADGGRPTGSRRSTGRCPSYAWDPARTAQRRRTVHGAEASAATSRTISCTTSTTSPAARAWKARAEGPAGDVEGQGGVNGDLGDPDVALVGFARALRGAGVPVTPDRTAGLRPGAGRHGGRSAITVGSTGRAAPPCAPIRPVPALRRRLPGTGSAGSCPGSAPGARGPWPCAHRSGRTTTARGPAAGTASARPRWCGRAPPRRRSCASATSPASPRPRRRCSRQLFATLSPRPPRRRAVRRSPWHSGDLDARRTLREELRRGGEPGRLRYRRRAPGPAAWC